MADPDEIVDAYDRYADQLYAYCRFMLPDQTGAMRALEDTFLVAAGRLMSPPAEEQLRIWLFAVARNECIRRAGPGRVAHAPSPEPAGPPDGGRDARALLRGAIGGLEPGDRDLIAMLWHGLEIDDIAAVLDIPREEAFPRMSRALGELEIATAALLVARSGRDGCASLDTLLGDTDGRLNVPLTRKLDHHIERCRTCSRRRNGELRPALLLSLTPGALLGAAVTSEALRPAARTAAKLRDQVLSLALDPSPEGDDERWRICGRADPFGTLPPWGDDPFEAPIIGYPEPLPAGADGTHRSRRGWIVAGAAAAAVVAVAASLAMTSKDGGTSTTSTGLEGLSRPPANVSVTTANAVTPSHRPSPSKSSASPTPSASPSISSASPSPSPTPSKTPSASASPSPSRTPSPKPSPTVTVPSSVTLEYNQGQQDWEGTLSVTVTGGSAQWTISNPNPGLQLSQSSGTSSASVQISGQASRHGAQPLTVTVGGKSLTVDVVLDYQGGYGG